MAAAHSPQHMVTRFAPSPTGRLHVGHGWSALMAFDMARAAGGKFLLRIEDIDGGRSRPEHIAGIEEDLAWLAIAWDGPVWRQSDRLAAYTQALARLDAMGLVYPCFCTRADIAREIADSASAPQGPQGPLYPGACRNLTDSQRRARIEAGEAHALRIDMTAAVARAGPLAWHDADAGDIVARPDLLGDVVLARKDAPASYHLAVTVDDAAQGVTDIVRGRDLFDATHVHRLLQALLDLPTPRYRHHGLLVDAQGRRLAKRDAALTLASLRADGMDGAVLAAQLRAGVFPFGIRLA